MPVILVLASGRGERFKASGATGSKLQADLGGITVLERTLQAVQASGLPWHLEDAGHPGMGDTIAAAVRATQDADGWMVLPADLPLVQASTLQALSQVTMAREVVVPVCEGQRGHPVRFSRACLQDLLSLSGSDGAASVVKAHGAQWWETTDRGCVTDIDTLDDLQAARNLLASD